MEYKNLFNKLEKILIELSMFKNVEDYNIDFVNKYIEEFLSISETNKMITFAKNFLNQNGIPIPPSWETRCDYYAAYHEALIETLLDVTEIFGDENIPFVVIKTLKNIPYDATDIDILIPKKFFSQSVKLLKDKGFSHYMQGTPELSLLRILRYKSYKISILVDLHYTLNVGTFQYLSTSLIMKNIRKFNLVTPYGRVLIPMPHIMHDLAIIAGHTLLKDMLLLIPDYVYTLFILDQYNYRSFLEAFEHLLPSTEPARELVSIFLSIVRQLSSYYSITRYFLFLNKIERKFEHLPYFMNILLKINQGFRFPFRIPFLITLYSYFRMLNYPKCLGGLLKLPSSKGLSLLLRRFSL
jgi:hypothetical protein